MCREKVGLISWLGKPLRQPVHMEQARVLRHPLEFRKKKLFSIQRSALDSAVKQSSIPSRTMEDSIKEVQLIASSEPLQNAPGLR